MTIFTAQPQNIADDDQVIALNGLGYMSHIDLGEDDARLTAEFGDDPDEIGYYLDFAFTESFDFAREHEHFPLRFTGADGEVDYQLLAPAVATVLNDLYRSRYVVDPTVTVGPEFEDGDDEQQTIAIDVEPGYGDDDGMVVTLLIPVRAAITVAEMFERFVHPFTALMINVCDPGTFNHPYLWSMLDRDEDAA